MIKYGNFVDFSKKENEENCLVEFECCGSNKKVEISNPTETRQKKINEHKRQLERKKKVERIKRNKMFFRRRVTALGLSVFLVATVSVGVKRHNILELSKDITEAYALEDDPNVDNNEYLEEQGSNISYNLNNEENYGSKDKYDGTVYNKKTELYKENKYGRLTEESVNRIKDINVKYNITPSDDNKIKYLKNAGRVETTIGEKQNILVDQNGENFLNMNLRTKSGLTSEQIDKALEGTGLEGLGEDYIKAEEDNNINAMFLVGLSCLESDFGNSNFARNRNNITGFRAYTENPGKAIKYETKGDCIYQTASYLDKYYMEDGSKYYNGKSMVGVNVKYCTSPAWAIKINNIMLKMFNDFV